MVQYLCSITCDIKRGWFPEELLSLKTLPATNQTSPHQLPRTVLFDSASSRSYSRLESVGFQDTEPRSFFWECVAVSVLHTHLPHPKQLWPLTACSSALCALFILFLLQLHPWCFSKSRSQSLDFQWSFASALLNAADDDDNVLHLHKPPSNSSVFLCINWKRLKST